MRGKTPGLALLAILLLPLVAAAQEWSGGRGRLEGSVKNEKGEPIAGATVVLRWENGKGPADLKTNDKGRWAKLGLVGGKWDVDISAPGYQTKKISTQLEELERHPSMDVALVPEVKQEAAKEEIMVGGQKISKETADSIDKANTEWSTAEKFQTDEQNCRSSAESAEARKKCADAAHEQRMAALAAAEADYAKALPELPDNLSILTRLEVGNYWAQNYDEALKYARKIAEKDPNNATSWLMIAEIELQKGNFDAGKEALSKVPEDQITDPQPYMNMGILYYNKNKPQEAADYFSKAIQKRPDDSAPYYYRGLARYQLKDKAGAKADLEKYLSLDPSGKDAGTVKELLKTLK
jgi:Flp pilus assembly protein TadD